MAFGFNLIGFPLLLLATAGLIIYYLIKRSKLSLIILASLWVLTILFFITTSVITSFDKPVSLTKEKIIGIYRIDTGFYPGQNANWQYDHFRFTITPTDSIYFYLINKDSIVKKYNWKLDYSIGPPSLWKIKTDSTYHVTKYPPTLFRGHKRFYYVFRSDKYGNMFFRKQ